MEVCRERGNIKLKSRPYTEVSCSLRLKVNYVILSFSAAFNL